MAVTAFFAGVAGLFFASMWGWGCYTKQLFFIFTVSLATLRKHQIFYHAFRAHVNFAVDSAFV